MSNRPRDFQGVLDKLPDARRSGDGWIAACPCPGHVSPKGHLTLRDGGDKVLVCCQGGRHSYAELCAALGFSTLAYSPNSGGGSTTIGKGCPPVQSPPKQIQKGVDTGVDTAKSGVSNVQSGVSLAALAEAKRLPVDFLRSLGVSDFKYNGLPSVKIPYYSEDGQELAVRFRLSLTGDKRFKWRKGDRAMPYGLNRLGQIRKAGWVLIVEGESDCWTARYHGIPALGAPGKGIWPPAWGEYLSGLEVYVWQEPDAEDFTLRILASAPDLRYIRAPDSLKDISEAHIRGLDIPAELEGLKASAEAGQALKARHDNERLAQLLHEAKAVIEAEDPLELIEDAIQGLGYGGDIRPALITYLAATSRLLEMRDGSMPVHLLLTGPSAIGKSYTLNTVKKLLPEQAHRTIDAGSPRTLIYGDAELQHRLLVFGEADSLPAGEDNPAASAIRNLLQDHCLHYEVTIRDADTGDFTVRKVVKRGPTVLITTSTRSLGEQLMTRLFALEISDSQEQIRAALETQASLETSGSQSPAGALVAFQLYLQLKAPLRVMVPFAKRLGQAMGNMACAPRILRDFQRLLSLIKAVAIIRHHWRLTDSKGRMVATLADYETVRELVAEMYVESTGGAVAAVRAVVEAVWELDALRSEGVKISNSKVARHLDIGTKQAERRLKRAATQGWLVNREGRKYHTADYAPGEPLPATQGLPPLDTLDSGQGVDTPPVQAFSFENGGLDRWTPSTDGDTPPPPEDAGGATDGEGKV